MRWRLGALTFLSIGVAVVAPLLWLVGSFDSIPDKTPLILHLLERAATSRAVFTAHIAGGAVALLVGPWQLMRRLRARHRNVHRAMGYTYVVAVGIAGTAGLFLGPRAWGGPVAQLGFTLLACAWLGTTAMGFQRIVVGDRAGHRAWIVRSFALTFAAVSLRMQSPLLAALGVPDAIAYPFVAWSSWVPNLLFVHFIAARSSKPVRRGKPRVSELEMHAAGSFHRAELGR